MVATRLDSRFRVACTSVLMGFVWLQVALLSGCKKPDEIRTYTVPHRSAPEILLQRMLGAIIPNDKEAWFFKLQGPDEEIAKLEPEFLAFTKSVKIKDKKVEWTAPKAWKKVDGGQFRFTTYQIPSGKEKPFELAVTRLDAPQGVDDAYLQANLTRWRGQLSLDPIEKEDVSKVTTPVEVDGGKAYMVNFVGEASQSSSMGMPGAAGPFAGQAPSAPAKKPTAPEAGAADFEFTTPKGWTPGKASAMRKASLAVADGDLTADVSVFAFPADSNDLLSNVNRWRGQVGLAPVTADELQKSAKKIEVSGHSGELVELVGKKETILGVMVKKGETAWFFKLQGPTELAGREKARFEEFVKSSRLP
ncbi:MAG: hypothetical protein JWN70_251 [Planctomycetaceae bacterium]|nr:hypothetical protein [Planctomycetaceae bacterium]